MSQQSATGATLAGIAHRFRRKSRIGSLDDGDRIDGKTCLVTGANVGLGKAIAIDLARRGGRVTMAGRTLDESARADICAASSTEVDMEHLDLADLATVHAFVDRVRERSFDIVVLNAGIVPRAARRTIDGLEEGFQVNFLATFLLVDELLSAGIVPARSGARIVFVSSESHRSADAIDWSELGRFRDYGLSGAVREYGHTKLLTCTHAAELARRLAAQEIAVHALCPGAVNTRLAREAPVWSQPLLKIAFALFFRAPEAAAEPVSYLACAPALEGRTGVYLHVMEEKPMAPLAMDPEQGAALLRACEALLTRLSPAAKSRG